MLFRSFFCGPHCSGKTSIIKNLLSDGLILERGSEIGKDLFYQRNIAPAQQGEEFELEITLKELMRDRKIAQKGNIIGIESWHPGNLAYAMVRNPSTVAYLVQEIKRSPILSRAFGIVFSVSWDNIYLRTMTFKSDRKWAADFYTQISSCIDKSLDVLGLKERCVFIDANRPYKEVYEDVKSAINYFMKFSNPK